jgi:hypothetical protein
MFKSSKLAEALWERIKKNYPYMVLEDDHGDVWEAFGLNEQFRLGHYQPGEKFGKHEDGYFQPKVNERSFATFMVYLNDVPRENGGATRFFDFNFDLHPKEGMGIAFVVDNVLHDGEELKAGEKYILRTDVMYRCDHFQKPELRQKIFDLKKQAEEAEERGDRQQCFNLLTGNGTSVLMAVKLWDEIFKLETQL